MPDDGDSVGSADGASEGLCAGLTDGDAAADADADTDTDADGDGVKVPPRMDADTLADGTVAGEEQAVTVMSTASRMRPRE
ncbi:MAG: hypothetical protein ACR2GO_09880 [Candidatus Limnocylindria bacterium]